MYRSTQAYTLFVLSLALVALAACGNSPSEPQNRQDAFLPPNPDGMLLPGDPETPAVQAAVSLEPSPVSADFIEGNLLRTRLRAILSPDATVSEVNTALQTHGATIVTMLKDRPMVVLKIDAVADEAGALAKASALQAEPAFFTVSPARQYESTEETSAGTSGTNGVTGLAEWPYDPDNNPPDTHLRSSRTPAAWNARRAMKEKASVLLPGQFLQLVPHDNIDALQFQEPNDPGFVLQGEDGNLGFHLAGIIGANYFDNPNFSGAHPGFDQLEVFGVPITGYDVFDLDVKLHTYLDDLNKNWVLATCLVRPDIPPMDQAVLAVMWQQDTELDLFLHVSKAGDTGDAGDYTANAANTSHWNMAGSYVDLALFLEDAGEPNIEGFYDLVDILNPPGQSENLITVGYSELSSDPEAPFKKALDSALLPDLETYGTDILGPCAPDGEAFDCPGGAMTQTGSAVATAHVAGVGAYLTSISPEKAPEEIRDVLEFAGTEGQHEHMIDAYAAVLALDPPQSQWFQNAATPRARMAILDVAGDSDAPGENGIFDDHDIRVLLDQFTFYEAERAVPGNELDFDFAPYDLNGDGWTGGESVSPLDLDANRSFGDAALEAGGLTVIKNEKSLTDLDILCYYAYSTLYMGSTARRSEMLSDCFPPSAIALDVTFPEIIEPGIPQTIQILAGRNTPDGIVYEAGTRININVSNGDVEDSGGETDASGAFTTTVTLDEDENEVDIIVQANFESGETAEKELTARRKNEVLILEREMEMQAYTSMSYIVNQGDNLTIVFDESEIDDDEDLLGDYENTEQTSNQGSTLGQNYSASTRTQYETQILGEQGAVTGIDFDASVEAEVELSGIPNVFDYQVWASGDAELDMEFQIWGEARAVDFNATINTNNYEVELIGEGTRILCKNNPFLEDGNTPCDSISESLVLRPGYYRLNVTFEGIVFLQPDQQAAGTNSIDYELSLRLDIGNAVADPPDEE